MAIRVGGTRDFSTAGWRAPETLAPPASVRIGFPANTGPYGTKAFGMIATASLDRFEPFAVFVNGLGGADCRANAGGEVSCSGGCTAPNLDHNTTASTPLASTAPPIRRGAGPNTVPVCI